jgi:hypothetical protein
MWMVDLNQGVRETSRLERVLGEAPRRVVLGAVEVSAPVGSGRVVGESLGPGEG